MNDLSPNQAPLHNDFDVELILTFLTKHQSLEQALVRAGFSQAGPTPGSARPDWEQFARHIEGKFDPESAPELMGAVCYLLADPEKHELRWERLQGAILGDPSSPESDILWLSELIQEIRHRLVHWINFAEEPWSDSVEIAAALLIIEAWAHLDPRVESLLTHVQ